MTSIKMSVNVVALLAIAWLCQQTCRAQSDVSASADHLIPPVTEDAQDAAYHKIMREKLFVTPANYGRILIIPSGVEGETSIALYSEATPARGIEFRITCTKAQKNIWFATSESSPKRSENPVIRVARYDATVPRTAIEAVHDALKKEIERRKPLEPIGKAYVDGTAIEFALPRSGGKTAVGILGPATQGPRISQLVRLTKALTRYCMSPSNRSMLVGQVEDIARSLR